MLLAELELDLEPVLPGLGDDLLGFQAQLREAFPTLDARDAHVRAKVQVGRERTLRHGNLEGAATCHSGYAQPGHGADLAATDALRGHHPAGHRDLHASHQMPTLLDMAFQRRQVVAGIERARGARGVPHADLLQVARADRAVGASLAHRPTPPAGRPRGPPSRASGLTGLQTSFLPGNAARRAEGAAASGGRRRDGARSRRSLEPKVNRSPMRLHGRPQIAAEFWSCRTLLGELGSHFKVPYTL